MELIARVSLKLVTKGFFVKTTVLRYYSKAKTKAKECHQSDLGVSDKSGIKSSARYLLEMSPRILLKIATKGFLCGKKILKI